MIKQIRFKDIETGEVLRNLFLIDDDFITCNNCDYKIELENIVDETEDEVYDNVIDIMNPMFSSIEE